MNPTTQEIESGRQALARELALPPEHLEFIGPMPWAKLLLYNVNQPEHPNHQSTRAWKLS